MTAIYNEIPVWVIDGVNKVFTLQNTPTTIMDIVLDGAEYYFYSVDGNNIILSDAPTLNLHVDYSFWPAPIVVWDGTGNTLKEIYDKVYSILWEDTDVQIFDLERVVIPTINEVQSDICKWSVVDETFNPPRTIQAADLRFMMKQIYIPSIRKTGLTASASIWSNTISFDTEWFSPSGYVSINGNIIQYTSTHGNMVTGIPLNKTKIEANHPIGSIVEQVYKLPTKATNGIMIENLNGLWQYGWGDRYIEFSDYRDNLTMYDDGFQILYDNNQTNDRYIRLLNYWYSDRFLVRFMVAGDEMIEASDICSLPESYGRKVIAPIVAGKLLYDTDEQALGISQLKKWYAELQSMYNYFAKMNKTRRDTVKVKPMNFTIR